MSPIGIIYLCTACVLGFLMFRLGISLAWHWALAIVVGALPIAATFFFGLLGLLGSALVGGGMYKASA